MKKSLLALLLAVFLVTGCGSSGDDVERLSKSDYYTQLSTTMTEISKSSANFTADPKGSAKEINEIVDKAIALNGPKDLEEKEKKIDEALEGYKELIDDLANINQSDISKLTEITQKAQTVMNDLSEALIEYNN